jgi:hypothetical protein
MTAAADYLPTYETHLCITQRPHEHFVQSQTVGTEVEHDVIGVDHVAAGLAHLRGKAPTTANSSSAVQK